MVHEDAIAFLQAAGLGKLQAAGRGRDAGNGTPLADAAATLLAFDARRAGMAPARIALLDDHVVEQTLEDVWRLLNDGRTGRIELPFGTAATSRARGSASIADVDLTLVEGTPGLTREELAPVDLEGSNLDILLGAVTRHVSRQKCRTLGSPEPVSVEGRFQEWLLRFPPCAEAGGVSPEFDFPDRPVCWRTHGELVELAGRMAEAMAAFWRGRAAIARAAGDLRARLAREISAAGAGAEELSIVRLAICPTQDLTFGASGFHVDVEALDDAMRPGVIRMHVRARDRFDAGWFYPIRHHASRRAALDAGEPTFIDDFALAIARAAPEGATAVLARLAGKLATDVRLPLDGGRIMVARLYWADGIVAADLFGTGRLEHSMNALTVIDQPLPETILSNARGRMLGEIVGLPFEAPFPITYVDQRGSDRVTFLFETEARTFDARTGAIGTEPHKL